MRLTTADALGTGLGGPEEVLAGAGDRTAAGAAKDASSLDYTTLPIRALGMLPADTDRR